MACQGGVALHLAGDSIVKLVKPRPSLSSANLPNCTAPTSVILGDHFTGAGVGTNCPHLGLGKDCIAIFPAPGIPFSGSSVSRVLFGCPVPEVRGLNTGGRVARMEHMQIAGPVMVLGNNPMRVHHSSGLGFYPAVPIVGDEACEYQAFSAAFGLAHDVFVGGHPPSVDLPRSVHITSIFPSLPVSRAPCRPAGYFAWFFTTWMLATLHGPHGTRIPRPALPLRKEHSWTTKL